MSEIVKVDGAWNLTPQLAKDMGMTLFQLKQHFAREYVIPYLAKQIDDRKLKGKDRSGQKGARSGFGEIFIDGKKKTIQNVTAYFDKRADNITFTDVGKNQAVAHDRAEGQYGFNPDTVKQVKFLDNVEELKAELKERTDFPKGPNDARNAEKDFHNKMRKLFRKNYRGRIQYDPNIGTNYGWPEGKSQKGFMKWQRYVYNRLKGGDGDIVHVGHGKPVNQEGTNAASNLALEDAKSNVSTGAKEGTFRPDEELENVYVSHGKSLALQEYLAFEDDENILTPMDLPPEDHANLLQNVDEDPEAIFAQGLDKRYNNSFEDSRTIYEKENKPLTQVQAALEAFGKSEYMNYLTGGASGQIVDANRTLNSLSKGNIPEAAMNVAPLLINASTITTISPLKETEKYLKAAQ